MSGVINENGLKIDQVHKTLEHFSDKLLQLETSIMRNADQSKKLLAETKNGIEQENAERTAKVEHQLESKHSALEKKVEDLIEKLSFLFPSNNGLKDSAEEDSPQIPKTLMESRLEELILSNQRAHEDEMSEIKGFMESSLKEIEGKLQQLREEQKKQQSEGRQRLLVPVGRTDSQLRSLEEEPVLGDDSVRELYRRWTELVREVEGLRQAIVYGYLEHSEEKLKSKTISFDSRVDGLEQNIKQNYIY